MFISIKKILSLRHYKVAFFKKFFIIRVYGNRFGKIKDEVIDSYSRGYPARKERQRIYAFFSLRIYVFSKEKK